tara:strand:+ start:15436 stop:22821 length:7386 start_codon:yes stop_codon:yes gene_type:complete
MVTIGASEVSPGVYHISVSGTCPGEGVLFSGTVGGEDPLPEGYSGSGSCSSVSLSFETPDPDPGIVTTINATVTVSPSSCIELPEAAPSTCPIPEDEGEDEGDDGCGEDQEEGDSTPDSVHNIRGAKVERSTDLVVPLPGRDFKLVREYNSDPDYFMADGNGQYYWNGSMSSSRPGFVGAQWSLNVMKFLYGEPFGVVPEDLFLAGYPMNTVRRFKTDNVQAPIPVYRAVGAANQTIIPQTTYTVNFGTVDVYSVRKPGGFQSDFIKRPSSFDPQNPPSGFGPEDLVGRLVREMDEFGNEWHYEWFSFVDSATSYRNAPRIKSIYLNGLPGSEVARVDFYWMGQAISGGMTPAEFGYLDDVVLADEHYGRLAEVRVVRSGEVVQKVRYIYFDEFADDAPIGWENFNPNNDPTVGEIYAASGGDLCEVIISERVDNDVHNTGSDDDFYDRVFQYRYYGGFDSGLQNGLGISSEFDFFGHEHQLLSVIYPLQMEYYADRVAREANASHPALSGIGSYELNELYPGLSTGSFEFQSVKDAAVRLRSVSYFDTGSSFGDFHYLAEQILLPNDQWTSLYDLSSKLLTYYSDSSGMGNRVKSQIVNAGDGSSVNCGCGSVPSGFRLGKRFDYLYKRFNWDEAPGSPTSNYSGIIRSDGYSFQVVESAASVNTSNQLVYAPYRVYTNDYYSPAPSVDIYPVSVSNRSYYKVAFVVSEGNELWDYDHLDNDDDVDGNTPYKNSGKHWVTRFDYNTQKDPTDSEYTDFRKKSRKVTTSALNNSEYVPALNGGSNAESPTLPSIKDTEGLIYTFGYADSNGDGTGWVTANGVQEGDQGTVELVTSYERSGASAQRVDLPITVNRHRSDQQGDVESTSITYQYRSVNNGYQAVSVETHTVDIETTEQNGPAGQVNPSKTYVRDTNGQARWIVDESGDAEYRGYDASTGLLSMVVQDADPSRTDYESNQYPITITPPPSRASYEELITLYEYDSVGRLAKMTDPGGVSSYYRHELRTSQIYDESGNVMINRGVPYLARLQLPHELGDGSFDGPITISWQDANGQQIRQSSYIATDGGQDYDPIAGEFGEGVEVARRDSERILSGSLKDERVWHDLANNGTYVTSYEFDTLGRILSITDPEGGVVQYGDTPVNGYDIHDRPLIVAQGTTTDGVHVVSRTYYDSPQTASQGVGNGNVTFQKDYTEHLGTPRQTKHWYDYRDRLVGTVSPQAPHQSMAYDNLDRVVENASWTTDSGFSSSGVPDPSTGSSDRSSFVERHFNNRGLLFRSKVAIDPTDSSPDFLESNRWYDAEGLVIAEWSPNGPATKYVYDALDRLSVKYITDRAGDGLAGTGSYEHADDLTDDHVIAQSEYEYVDAGTPGAGSVELMTARARLHDADESGGSEVTGALDGTNSIATFSAYVYDDAGRFTDSIEYGSNGSGYTAGTSAPSTPFVTDRSTSNALISSIGFDEWGRTRVSTDPEGKETITKYDDMSRAVGVIESAVSLNESHITWSSGNWTVSWPGGAPADQDRVTTFAYDGLSNVVKRTAHLNDGTTQVTQYDYGTTLGSASIPMDTLVNSSSLLAAVHYPNESDGLADTSSAYTVSYAYNMLGELRGMTDQNGTEHAYIRDDLGRVTSDSVTITDMDLDSTIDSIEVSYDAHGRVEEVLSKGGTTIINGVALEYTPLHQVQRIFQNPDGDPSDTGVESIGYAYDNQEPSATGGNFSRLAKVWYPTEMDLEGITPGTPITTSTLDETMSMDYSGVINDRISRVTGMDVPGWGASVDDLVRYEYLGLRSPVRTDYPTVSVSLDYTKSWDGSNPANAYPAFDQYGRIVWHGWVKDGFTTGPNTGFPDRTPHMARRYEYDKISNRIKDWDGRPGASDPEVFAVGRDWEYEYDELDRLETAKRGTRDDYATGVTFTKAEDSRQWALDMLGNWDSITLDTDTDWDFGTNPDVNSRSHNAANEVTSLDPIGVGSTLDPTYDDAGNFKLNTSTQGPNGRRYVHDAWNRLVRVETNPSGSSPVSVLENEYNGLNWRVKRRMDLSKSSPDGLDEERVYYYSASWQMIEEEVDTDLTSGEEYTSQQFWGSRYIDDAVAKRIDRDNDQVWTDASSKYHYLTDVMFSVRAIVDYAGMIAERVDYTPYGVAQLSYPGDVNNDGNFNFLDLSVATTSSVVPGDSNFDPDVDFDFSGTYNFLDYSAFYAAYSLHGNSDDPPEGWISDPGDAAPVGSTVGYGPDNSVGYDGYLFDASGATDASATGVYMVRNRVYDPGIGRWLQRDPIGYVDGPNLYRYGRSSPARYIDPLGLDPIQNILDKYPSTIVLDFVDGQPVLKPSSSPMVTPNATACDGYKYMENATCDDGKGCSTAPDNYPDKAHAVCLGFLQLYDFSDKAACVANCLIEQELFIQLAHQDCDARNRSRLRAHVGCYTKCKFIPTKGLPPGAAAVGWGDLLPSEGKYWAPSIWRAFWRTLNGIGPV